MSKVTAYRSDLSDKFILDDKQRAQIRVTFPGDKRRTARLIDATVEEVEEMFGDKGRAVNSPPGRQPARPE